MRLLPRSNLHASASTYWLNAGIRHVGKNTQTTPSIVLPVSLMKSRYPADVGQTGPCFSEGAKEHDLSIEKGRGAHLPTLCNACSCGPQFSKNKILNKSKDREARESIKAYYIRKRRRDCVSDTSIALYSSEMGFLENVWRTLLAPVYALRPYFPALDFCRSIRTCVGQ